MKYQFVYLNVVTGCLNELDSVCLNGRAGQGILPGGSLKYLFVYLKVRIFTINVVTVCIYSIYCVYIYILYTIYIGSYNDRFLQYMIHGWLDSGFNMFKKMNSILRSRRRSRDQTLNGQGTAGQAGNGAQGHTSKNAG
jgi:hypothetical protein